MCAVSGLSRAIALLVFGAAVAIVVAGCGGGGSRATDENGNAPAANSGFSAYETSMQRLGVSLGTTLGRVGSANRAAEPAQIARNLRTAQRELRATATKLTQITPPEKIKAQHALLTKGVREYADELDGVIARVKRGNPDAVREILTLKGVKDMTRASAAIAKAGYTIVLGG